MSTLKVALVNRTTSSQVYVYITGRSISSNAIVLIEADGHTPYFPASPNTDGSPLARNVSIPLGPPGSTTYATIPQIAGGRIWFSVDSQLTFFLNPGPGLVEPSPSNPSDPNINKYWDFCEFTFNNVNLFANITNVDFVSVPIALTVTNTAGQKQHVSGMTPQGLAKVAAGLTAQSGIDGRRWKHLIQHGPDGRILRIISPNNAIHIHPDWFKTYWDDYINRVEAYYANHSLRVDLQNASGDVTSTPAPGGFMFQGRWFPRPTAADIFSCSTGPFAPSGDSLTQAIVPRLAAAFNRSTLLQGGEEPNGSPWPKHYVNEAVTNHYSRIVHAALLDGRGYAFPYDDVRATGDGDRAGIIQETAPALFEIEVGGGNAHI